MNLREHLFQALGVLVDNRVYPDIGPASPVLPYITHQQVGGDPVNFIEGGQPSKANARMQVNVWAATRAEAATLAQAAETALRGVVALQTTVSTQPMDRFDDTTRRYGTTQFFSCWSDI